MIEKEIKTHDLTTSMISSALPNQDPRLQHVLVYFAANRVPMIYRQQLMLDILRSLPISNEEIRYDDSDHSDIEEKRISSRLRIFKYQAQVMCNEMQMSVDQAQEYQVGATFGCF